MSDQALANVPEDDLTTFQENLAEETRDLADRLADQAVGANKVPEEITPEKEALVLDYISQSRQLLALAEKTRIEKRDPHKNRVEAVQDRFKTIVAVLTASLEPVLKRHGAYRLAQEEAERKRRAEEARVKREEEERKRREAEAAERAAQEKARKAKSDEDRRNAAAALQRAQREQDEADEAAEKAKAADRATKESLAVEGDLGSKGFSAGTWKVTAVDMKTVDLEALRPHLKVELVQQAARAWMREQGDDIEKTCGDLEGVTIEYVRSARYK